MNVFHMISSPTVYMKRIIAAKVVLIFSCVFILLNIHESQKAMLMLNVMVHADIT